MSKSNQKVNFDKLKRQNLCHKAEEKGVYVELFKDFFNNTMKGDLSGAHASVYAQYSRFLDVVLVHLKQSMKDGSNHELLSLCPCPPETLSCAVKCDLDEVDGGNLSYLDQLSSALCACGRVLSENDLSLMMCPICAQFKYNDDYDVPVNGMELPSNLE